MSTDITWPSVLALCCASNKDILFIMFDGGRGAMPAVVFEPDDGSVPDVIGRRDVDGRIASLEIMFGRGSTQCDWHWSDLRQGLEAWTENGESRRFRIVFKSDITVSLQQYYSTSGQVICFELNAVDVVVALSISEPAPTATVD